MAVNDQADYSRLIAALRALTLQQEETQRELEELREEVHQLRTRVEDEPLERRRTTRNLEAPVVATIVEAGQEQVAEEVSIGDIVTLNNPGRARTNRGRVTGTTLGGFLRITLDNGQVVRRLPRNVSKIQE